MNDIYIMFEYRGMTVNIYNDDPGQCFDYEIFDANGRKVRQGSCGAYNPDYESEPKFIIDEILDVITYSDRPHGILRFADHEHTTITLQHRSTIIKTYTITPVHNLDDITKIAFDDLMEYCSTPEYLAAEEKRLAAGKLYFDEFMDRTKRGNN